MPRASPVLHPCSEHGWIYEWCPAFLQYIEASMSSVGSCTLSVFNQMPINTFDNSVPMDGLLYFFRAGVQVRIGSHPLSCRRTQYRFAGCPGSTHRRSHPRGERSVATGLQCQQPAIFLLPYPPLCCWPRSVSAQHCPAQSLTI